MAEFDITTQEDDFAPLPEGMESEWQSIGSLKISSGQILMGDAVFLHGKRLPLPPGEYTVWVKDYTPNSVKWITRLRVASSLTGEYARRECSYSIDSAYMGVVDGDLVDRAFKKLSKEEEDAYVQRVFAVKLVGWVALPQLEGEGLWTCLAGHGDGFYDIFSLKEGGVLVGYETIFIGKDPAVPSVSPACPLP